VISLPKFAKHAVNVFVW